MPIWAIILIVIAAGLLIFGLWVMSVHNGLVKLDERVNEAWSDITVQLKYRADLIPNVVKVVKKYAEQEQDIFKSLAESRAKMMGARTVADAQDADRGFMGVMGRLMAVTENYPELKSNENFKDLTNKLQDCEDKLQAARRFYNAGAKQFNTKIKLFPANTIAKKLGFGVRDYYEVSEDSRAEMEKSAPEVDF